MKTIPKNIKLETKRLILRPVWFADPVDIAKKADNFKIARFVGKLFPFPYKLKNSKEFIEMSKENWCKDEKKTTFAIFKKEKNEFIGCVGIKISKTNNIVSNIGYWIAEEYWSNGYTSEAVAKLCDFSFKELNVRKINGFCASANKGSMRVFEKNKFKLEGVKKKNKILRNGTIVDDMLYGKLKK